MKKHRPSIPKLAGLLCLATSLPLAAELLIYEAFEYSNPGEHANVAAEAGHQKYRPPLSDRLRAIVEGE